MYGSSEIKIISKRKPGYKAGAYKKPPVTLDKTKTVLKESRELLEKKKSLLEKQRKINERIKKKLLANEEKAFDLAEDVRIISSLLAIKRKNLKNLGLLDKIE